MVQANKVVVVVAVLLSASLSGAQPKPPGVKVEVGASAPAVDLAALADRLVGTTANVKEGEIVEIVGGPTDLALVEELAVAVRKRGAHPIVTYGSESLTKKMIASVPEKYDAQPPKAAL